MSLTAVPNHQAGTYIMGTVRKIRKQLPPWFTSICAKG